MLALTLESAKDPVLFADLLDAIRKRVDMLGKRPAIMEVCGSHTWAISQFGIRDLLSDSVDLISGPGCPVCVTSQSDIDAMVSLSQDSRVTVVTYGDMFRVPGKGLTLEMAKAGGADVRIVYSPATAVRIAQDEPDREVVFLAVGFETTAPLTGLVVKDALSYGIRNFSVFVAHKTMPEALRWILSSDRVRIDGLLLPGHVSAVTGRQYFDFVSTDYAVPAAVTGFEPNDILIGILSVLEGMTIPSPRVTNMYPRAVREEGNTKALNALREVFRESTALWRGLGELPHSGLSLRDSYRQMDAVVKFGIQIGQEDKSPPGCDCHLILTGCKKPVECRLFGKVCNPENPVGPCMVSQEGACRAYYSST